MVKEKPLFACGSWPKRYSKTLYLYGFSVTLVFFFDGETNLTTPAD